jgi:putative endonuclease
VVTVTDDLRRELGQTGEQLAAEHLERLGFAVVERNFRTRWGELDIVACDGSTLLFCEVKTRRRTRGGRSPLESVHSRKQSQVRRMAARWLAERQERPRVRDLRFDATGVTLDDQGRLVSLEHLEAAF